MVFYLEKMTHSFSAKNRSAFVKIACSKFLAYFEILTFKALAESILSKNTSFETRLPDNYHEYTWLKAYNIEFIKNRFGFLWLDVVFIISKI